MEEKDRDERISRAAESTLNLSHGVKNILQAVKGGMDVVEKSLEINDIERTRRAWPILRRNLDKVNKLVLDMLKYSGENEPEFGSCDLNGLVAEAVETVRVQAGEQGKVIKLSVDERITDVNIDADQIYDVILNLLLNAVDAVEADAGVIEVSTRSDAGQKRVTLTVSDNGAGIADTETIFEPFRSSKPKVGTGLGLPIARKIVSQHGGTIHVQSQPGEGATFIVSLPVERV